ncbi:ECF RNA polymerase sigma factor SigW [subsurface metagenome]
MPETDKYYIERCLDGHPDDFRYIVRRYQAVLLAHLAGKLGNKDRAEEAAQESLVRAYFNMNKLQKPESFFSWLLGIADRVAKEHQRKDQIRRQRETIRSFSQEAPSPARPKAWTGSDPTSSGSQDYALEAAIAKLPESYRRVVLLRYYGDRSCSQVAEQFDIPLGTVTKTLSRAYAMLRKSLQQKEETQVSEV